MTIPRQSARSSARSCTSARSWPGSSTTTGSPFLWSTHRFENQFLQILDHGNASAWQDFVITTGGHFGRVLLLRRCRHRGPVGHPWQWAGVQGQPFFTMFSPQLKLLNLWFQINRPFFSASVQPPCGRYQGKVGLVLPVLPHHPVCLLLRVAQGDQPVQNIGNS